jgi:nucleoid DNA-binding protein
MSTEAFKRPVPKHPKTKAPKRATVTPRTGGFHTSVIAAVAKAHGVQLSKAAAETVCFSFSDRLVAELSAGHNVLVSGLGTFKIVPRTTKAGTKALRVKFSPGEQLRNEIKALPL